MGIAGPYGIGAGAAVGRLRGGAGPGAGFTVPDGPAANGVRDAAAVGLTSLLGLQEAGQDAGRDRDAREHGEGMLAALADLQRALLGGSGGGELERLAALVRRVPTPADPRLLAVQRAVLLRVAVELVRRRIATSL